jgi:response regulator NasT
MAYLVKPFSRSDLAPAIEVAVSRFAEIAALEAEVADLGERLETRKLVERAKSALQGRFSMSEAEAFRWIQKAAMDRRLSMRDVAETVLASAPAAPVSGADPADGGRAGAASSADPPVKPASSP